MRLFFGNNILTQNITLLPEVSSKCTEQNKKYTPLSKEASNDMIRIFAQIFDYVNIFLKSKTNMDEDKKEIFRIEIIKKG